MHKMATIKDILEAHCKNLIKRYKVFEGITYIFEDYEKKFKSPPTNGLCSEYETAIGFNKHSRNGSHPFCNQFGKFIEEVMALSSGYERLRVGSDGETSKYHFEIKSRFNTMKQSQAVAEITPKLKIAIKKGKGFILLVIVDESSKKSRKTALHMGTGMTKIKDCEGYDPKKHLWISGDAVYKFMFPLEGGVIIKYYILSLLESAKIS